jgi:RNA polymerase subunit RPABC4/transcription elongation factor Spt4
MPAQIASLVDTSVLSGVAFAIGVAGIGLWLAAAWWTYGDMARRTNSDLARYGAAAWIILSTPALLLISLPVYLLARPQATAAQRRSRDLVVALSPELFGAVRCEACGESVDEDWRRCPACATWLQEACVDCGRWSATNLELCPWCATSRVDDLSQPDEADEADEADVAAAHALEPAEVAAAYALDPDDVDPGPEARPATAPLPVFSMLHEVPILAPALAEASSAAPSAIYQPVAGTPSPRDLHRSGGRGRGFDAAVDELPAAIGR